MQRWFLPARRGKVTARCTGPIRPDGFMLPSAESDGHALLLIAEVGQSQFHCSNSGMFDAHVVMWSVHMF